MDPRKGFNETSKRVNRKGGKLDLDETLYETGHLMSSLLRLGSEILWDF